MERIVGFMPGVRAISAKLALIRFARLLGILCAGVPITAALRLAADASGSAIAALSAKRAEPLPDSGQNTAAALKAVGLVPPQVSNPLGTGSETGKIDQALERAATALEKETILLIHKFCVALGVVAMIDIGVLVGLSFASANGVQVK